jgi:hypothetical protein
VFLKILLESVSVIAVAMAVGWVITKLRTARPR